MTSRNKRIRRKIIHSGYYFAGGFFRRRATQAAGGEEGSGRAISSGARSGHLLVGRPRARGPHHPSLRPMERRRRPRNPDSESRSAGFPPESGRGANWRPSKSKGLAARSIAALPELIRLPAVAPAGRQAHCVEQRRPGFGSCLHSFGQSLGAPCQPRGTCRARSGKLKPGRMYKDTILLLSGKL